MEFTTWYASGGAGSSFIYMLTAILCVMSVLAFMYTKFDILNPLFIASSMFALCCAFDCVYTETWNLPLHFNTAVVIVGMMICFFLGGGMAYRQPQKMRKEAKIDTLLHMKIWMFWGVLLFLLLLLGFQYLSFLDIAHRVTKETTLAGMLRPVVEAQAHGTERFDRWYTYRRVVAQGIAYISFFALGQNLLEKRYKECIRFLSFIVLYVPFIVLTGGRQTFLYLSLFGVISFILLYRRKNGGLEYGRSKELLILGSAFFLFLGFFWLIGATNGKIREGYSILRVLSHYVGTNISAFDVFLNEMAIPENQYIGEMTLPGYYKKLNIFGAGLPDFHMYITMFVVFDGITTNVYTALRRYIQDYGFTGCAIIMFLIGFCYTKLYLYVKQRMSDWGILLYAAFSFPIFLLGREERFMNEVLVTGTIYLMAVMFCFYKLLKWQSK